MNRRKQPGLIDEVLMAHKNPANKPSHMHVMRWREQKHWEAVFANPEFQKVLQANSERWPWWTGLASTRR